MIGMSTIGILSILRAMVESKISSISSFAFCVFLSTGSRGSRVWVRNSSRRSASIVEECKSSGIKEARVCENALIRSASVSKTMKEHC
jgi:hypothetical protein